MSERRSLSKTMLSVSKAVTGLGETRAEPTEKALPRKSKILVSLPFVAAVSIAKQFAKPSRR